MVPRAHNFPAPEAPNKKRITAPSNDLRIPHDREQDFHSGGWRLIEKRTA